ncbi:MAG: glycosyltransferase family 2 protein [Parabacteroides sp.]|nr:glycosyltransferase family 2 protein [Parabacteroides sp.]
MKWYKKYLPVYGRPYESVESSILHEINEKISTHNKEEHPTASVVVIAHNEQDNLIACLWSLANNKSRHSFEIIGIDNNSTDQTEYVYRQCGVRYFKELRKGPGFARSCGQDHARGKYYLCIDADTLYPPLYIETMLSYLEKKDVAAVTGIYRFIPDGKFSSISLLLYDFARFCHFKSLMIKRPEAVARGAVFCYKTELGREVGYRTDIKRGEDGSMALRLKKYGKIILVTNRKAWALTSYRSILGDGSMLQILKRQIAKHMKHFFFYFKPKKVFKDEESNLIK